MKMKLNILLAMLMSFLMASTFAGITKVEFKKSENSALSKKDWKMNTTDDGLVFLFGPERPDRLVIHVDKNMGKRKVVPDYVTVFCNATENRLGPGAKLTCYGNYSDVSYLSVKKEDFRNGASGTYEFKLPK